MTYPPSELIINTDGSIFHLHLKPENLANKVILVGDPGRVDTVASYFDSRECDIQSREFHTITGTYQGKRISVISTGIGCDNCDIVINELDALKNIDFCTRENKDQVSSLEIVRIGTCGGLQPNTPIGTYICSETSIGFDGLLNYYEGRDNVCNLEMEDAFKRHMNWHARLGAPYCIPNDTELLKRIYQPEKGMVKGITIACGGFYGPQGRRLRIPLADPLQNQKIEEFEYNGARINNFEMESSAIAGLSKLLGHKALTVCMVVANRKAKEANANYKNQIEDLIKLVLDRI
ncbi:MAG: nucleoside phosphorylase [Bacteroidaceae bacterium]|nr:nucleoside phosphorylase [Bacteroidaceae bacterium]